MLGSGVVLAITGVVLYLTAPDGRSDKRAAHLVPVAGAQNGGSRKFEGAYDAHSAHSGIFIA